MQVNPALKILAGAVAVALSGGAFAQTTQTIVLDLIDTTNGNSLVFDTSLPTSTSDPGAQSFNVASTSAYQAFIAGETNSSDVLYYNVLGYNNSDTIDTTANVLPTVKAGIKSNDGAIAISQWLSNVANPSGGATFLPASTTPAAAQWLVDYDTGYSGDIGATDLTAVGTAVQFYAITTTNPSGTRSGASVAALSSSWTLSSAGLLTYGSINPVPLPAPVWLMISGLGLMGVVARRRQSNV